MVRLHGLLAELHQRLNERNQGVAVSEQANATAKLCPVCERVKILNSLDLCSGCAMAAENEARFDTPKIERFAAKHRAFADWCETHGEPNPYD